MSNFDEKTVDRIKRLEREVERLRVKEKQVFVPLTTPLTSSSWLLSSGGRSNTSSTLIDLSSEFGVPAGVKAVLIRLVVRDSGAFPQDEKYVSFGPSSTYYYALSCYALGGDYQSSDNGIVPCDSNGDIYYRVVASGTGTMDVNLEIWGYWL